MLLNSHFKLFLTGITHWAKKFSFTEDFFQFSSTFISFSRKIFCKGIAGRILLHKTFHTQLKLLSYYQLVSLHFCL